MEAWWFILVMAAGLFVFHERWRTAGLRRRHEHERLWMSAIPASDRDRVATLLGAVCEAFLIPARHRFRLRPSDQLQDLYRRNMRGQCGDSMEFEHLAISLECEFGIRMEDWMNDPACTVGSLVRRITTPNRRLGHAP